MARIGLRPGVWINAASFVLAGGGAVTAASATQTATIVFGWVGVCLGIALIIWGLTINGHPWWRFFQKMPPQLYLYLTPDGRPDRLKNYHITWSANDYFNIRFSNKSPIGETVDPADEKAFVLYLFNAGPEDTRHIRINWEIPGLDVCAAVEATGLFDNFIEELSPNRLMLAKETGASSRPLANEQEEVCALLRAGNFGDTILITEVSRRRCSKGQRYYR